MNVTHPPTRVESCPSTFDAEPYTKVSQSAYDKPVADAAGQQPTMLDQLADVPLTRAQAELLAALPNPSWTATYERVVLDDPVEHQVADCPNCGTPIKVG